MEFLQDLWFRLTWRFYNRIKRAFFFSFKRFKWFLGIKEPPLINVEVMQMPSEILGDRHPDYLEGMLFIKWQRKGLEVEAFQMQKIEFEYLLKSSKKQTFSLLPADVEAALKNNSALRTK